jgi:hypothetical protein
MYTRPELFSLLLFRSSATTQLTDYTSLISQGYMGEMVLLYTLARIINSTPPRNNVIYCIVLLLAIINVPTGNNVVFISRCLVTDPNNVFTSNDQCQCRLQRERTSFPSFLFSRSFSLCGLWTDRKENTASNNSSIVEHVSVARKRVYRHVT